MTRRLFLAAALAAATLPAFAQSPADKPVELDGVRYEPAVTLGGSRLVLNGAGIRYKAMFKVYTAGLYLGAKTDNPAAVLAAPGAKRMHIVMLREIDATELGRLFTRGMQDNASKDDFSKSIPGTLKMADLFSQKKKLAKGESFSVDWVPGTGTVVSINGKPAMEPIREPEFHSTLLRIWLGEQPADRLLKDALLGKAPAPRDPFTN